MGVAEMILIGQLIARVFKSKGRETDISQVRNQLEELCHAFPLYST
jgi:glycine/serine hydroxymethyltransferase